MWHTLSDFSPHIKKYIKPDKTNYFTYVGINSAASVNLCKSVYQNGENK